VWFNTGSAFKWYQSGSLMADLTSTGFTCYNTVNISGGALQVGGVQVVAARNTGWAAMTGTPNKATVYDVSTVTLAQLAARVAQLQAVLTSHGLIGA
jgi:hypothetical protein